MDNYDQLSPAEKLDKLEDNFFALNGVTREEVLAEMLKHENLNPDVAVGNILLARKNQVTEEVSETEAVAEDDARYALHFEDIDEPEADEPNEDEEE